MHQFDEHHPEFHGFSAYYDRFILPRLLEEEPRRQWAVFKLKRTVVPYIIGWVILFTLMLVSLTFEEAGLSFALLFTAICIIPMVLYFKVKAYIEPVRIESKHHILEGICRFLRWTYMAYEPYAAAIPSFVKLGLLPAKFDVIRTEDKITGVAHGAKFQFYEAQLLKRRKSDGTVEYIQEFFGQVLTLEFDQEFLGSTVVLRDKGLFNPKRKMHMKRVGLVDPVFEKIFEAFGTDQVEARYLLTPTFMQRLVDLEAIVDGKNIRFGFEGGQLLIAIETKNRYEPGSMFKPLMETDRTQKILNEIGAIFDVIDGVMKPPER